MSRIRRAAAAIEELRLLPLAFFIALPVLAVRAAIVPVAPDATGFWPGHSVGDIRSWWKAALTVGIAGWMLFFALARWFAGWRPRHRVFGLLVLIAALSILASTVLSPFRNTAWIGYTTLYEGALVLWAYLAGAWYAAEMADRDGEPTFLLRLIGVICLFEALHGIGEGFGWHIWQTDFGKWLMAVGDWEVRYQFAEARMAFGTVFQPNHYGMMMAMLGMLALGMVWREEKKGWRYLWLITYLASVAAIFCSNSRSGFLVLALLTVARLVVAFGRGRAIGVRSRGLFFGIAVATAIGCAAVPVTRNAAMRLVGRLGALYSPVVNEDAFAVRTMELRNDRVRLVLSDGALLLAKNARGGWTYAMEGGAQKDTPETTADDSGWMSADVSVAPAVNLRYRRVGNAVVTIGGLSIELYSVGTRIWYFDKMAGLLRPEVPPSRFVPSALDGFMNGRWYIWRRTLETAAKAPWFGSGPGALALAYPNDDVVNSQRMGFTEHEDKGHGVWASSLAQLGIVGTVACGACVCYVLLALVRERRALGNPVFWALMGYGICSIANDSTVGVTPVFCVLVGLALAEGGSAGKDPALAR